MRKAFNFYRSFWEPMKLLNKTQKSEVFTAICEVHFLEKHIDDVSFNTKATQLVWVAIKHSLLKSIEGYCSKMNIDYDKTLTKGLDKNHSQAVNNKEKKKDKGNDKEKEEGKDSTLPLILHPELESDAKTVAKYLLKKILDIKPNFKKPDIVGWEKDIEKAINDDGRSVDELIGCIDWIYTPAGSFWVPHILNAKKLREKFDTMESQMMNDSKSKSKVKTALVLQSAGYTS
jgi:hypothetical protein